MSIDLDALEAQLDKAYTHVCDIAQQKTRWKMTIPADEERDSDLILSTALADAQKLIAEVRTLRAQLANEERAMEEVLTERDNLRDVADALAEHISKLTGVDIGEHSNANNPWGNALNAQPRKDGQ